MFAGYSGVSGTLRYSGEVVVDGVEFVVAIVILVALYFIDDLVILVALVILEAWDFIFILMLRGRTSRASLRSDC